MKKGLRRAGIVGLSTLVAGSVMTGFAVPAQANWAVTGGEIGLVDTDTTVATNGTQGATLVTPGVVGQALGDVRVLLPNTFVNGDTIDLTIFDRTATSTSAGQINADADHKLGFSAVPTIAVNATPFAGPAAVATTPATVPTHVGPLSNSPGNTEGTTANGNAATPYVASPAVPAAPPAPAVPATVKPTTPPVFTTSLVRSSRAGTLASDIIRLTVNGVQASGDANADWVVTVSGLKADLGPAVSPGELRVVPFAYNGTPTATTSNPSPLFATNLADIDGNPATFDPRILIYTVPAYVAPVSFTIGTPTNVVADGTPQTVGDITISETNNTSLQDGTYTLSVGSAIVRNSNGAPSPVTVTTTGAATGETVSSPAVVTPGTAVPDVPGTVQFTIAGASNTSKISVKLSGLLLSDTAKGPISYTLTGGSIGDYLKSPAGTSPAIGTVAADSAFGSATAVNQDDIQAPTLTVNAVSTPIAFRIGGIDRYETAEKIALAGSANQPFAILASGENFPDALSSSYLASETGASILLTRQNALPASTVEGMRLLGVHTVYVIGGIGAISAGVEAQLRATSQYYPGGEVTIGQGKLQVIRLGGADRYATNKIVNIKASALSTDVNPVGRTSITFGQPSKLTALVATGENFPDALAGGPATQGNGSGNLPLILTHTATLDAAASSQMTSLGIEQAVILGKEGAVSTAVETSITGLGVAVDRIGGADRFVTATMVADFEIAATTPTTTTTGGLGFVADRVFLARGDLFPDALAGGPLAGGLQAPIVLTNPTTLSPPTKTWLTANAARLNFATALGLGGAVSASVLNEANAALGG